jgi:hypothetical protein
MVIFFLLKWMALSSSFGWINMIELACWVLGAILLPIIQPRINLLFNNIFSLQLVSYETKYRFSGLFYQDIGSYHPDLLFMLKQRDKGLGVVWIVPGSLIGLTTIVGVCPLCHLLGWDSGAASQRKNENHS